MKMEQWQKDLLMEGNREEINIWLLQGCQDLSNFGNDLYFDESNWNNGDISSGQNVFEESKIIRMLEEFKDEQE